MTVHGELVDHLPEERTSGTFVVEFELPVGLRDLVQSCGIPHVEVAEVRGGWERRVDDGEEIDLRARYPNRRPEPNPAFLLDVHLGKLARLLRLLGFDTAYSTDAADDWLAGRASQENRILLTRDRGLLMRSMVRRGRWVRATDPLAQASEILHALHLVDQIEPFTRCMDCNGLLEPADPSTVEVPIRVRRLHDDYRRCAGCGRVYWRGSHHPDLEKTVGRIVEDARSRS